MRQECRFCSSANKNLVLLFGFPPVVILKSNRFQCVISQIKENKFLIKFIIYYFSVGMVGVIVMIVLSYDRINLLLRYCFLHIVHIPLTPASKYWMPIHYLWRDWRWEKRRQKSHRLFSNYVASTFFLPVNTVVRAVAKNNPANTILLWSAIFALCRQFEASTAQNCWS